MPAATQAQVRHVGVQPVRVRQVCVQMLVQMMLAMYGSCPLPLSPEPPDEALFDSAGHRRSRITHVCEHVRLDPGADDGFRHRRITPLPGEISLAVLR